MVVLAPPTHAQLPAQTDQSTLTDQQTSRTQPQLLLQLQQDRWQVQKEVGHVVAVITGREHRESLLVQNKSQVLRVKVAQNIPSSAEYPK